VTGADGPDRPRRWRRPANQSRRYGRRDDPGDAVDLVRVAVDLPPRTLAALDELCEQGQLNRADVINRAVRVALLLRRYANDHGVTTVTAPDGRQFDVEVT
jgi:hypothetical protein